MPIDVFLKLACVKGVKVGLFGCNVGLWKSLGSERNFVVTLKVERVGRQLAKAISKKFRDTASTQTFLTDITENVYLSNRSIVFRCGTLEFVD